MTDPLFDRDALNEVLRIVAEEASRYLDEVDSALVRPPVDKPGEALERALPMTGAGSLAAVRELPGAAEEGPTRSAGPRFFHFVMGGGTPAALAADWLTSALDQIAFNWVSSPFAMRLEQNRDVHDVGSDQLDRPTFGNLAPEMSRRARGLAVWATLRAYGRDGYRSMIERHLALAQRLAAQVDAEPDLERLADVPLNVVCFRYHPRDQPDDQLDELNRRLGEAILKDGHVYFGTTVYAGKVAFRPAIVNWRTRPEDIDVIVPTTLRLGEALRPPARATSRSAERSLDTSA